MTRVARIEHKHFLLGCAGFLMSSCKSPWAGNPSTTPHPKPVVERLFPHRWCVDRCRWPNLTCLADLRRSAHSNRRPPRSTMPEPIRKPAQPSRKCLCSIRATLVIFVPLLNALSRLHTLPPVIVYVIC